MRNPELDSMRGLAALAVVAYQAIATNSPGLATTIGLEPIDGIWQNIAAYSPLRITWLGAESVWFFFVLSGLVLTRSAMRPGFSWNAYFPSRLVRLYLPVIFAVALAWLIYLLPHVWRPGIDPNLPTSYPLDSILSDLTLLGGTSASMGVLWSLQWEVIFSLLLPVYVLLARSHPRIAGAVAAILLILGWMNNIPAASYLPMFFVGSLLAQHWDRIEERLTMLKTPTVRNNLVCSLLLVVAICAITSFYSLGPHIDIPSVPARVITLPIVLAGIVMIIVLGHAWAPLRSVLTVRPLAWLGKVSFSLYLVHLPIVYAVAFLIPSGWAGALVCIGASVIVAAVFYAVAERPTHRLAQRVRVAVTDRDPALSAD